MIPKRLAAALADRYRFEREVGAGGMAAVYLAEDPKHHRQVAIKVVLRADSAAKVHDEVFLLGDNTYPNGSARDYATCFTPSWGDTAKLIMRNVRPWPGNHEHLTDGAAAYYEYFGNRAGSSKRGHYSYDIGEWHVIVLNSEIVVNSAFTAEELQAQEAWLAGEVKSNKQKCTLAYWHHPRFSSGWHGSDPRIGAFWVILYAGGVDLVLNGHDHEYERFLPQTPTAIVDSTNGIIQFVVGTGGDELRGFKRIQLNSARRVQGHYGVLKLTLGATEWRSAFIDIDGRLWDQTGGTCHLGDPGRARARARNSDDAHAGSAGNVGRWSLAHPYPPSVRYGYA